MVSSKRIRAFFFDLDYTLCYVNEPISQRLLSIVRQLSETDVVSIVSGKPLMYVSGLARQAGLKNCYLFGENAFRYMAFTFPPVIYGAYEIPQDIQFKLDGIAHYFKQQTEIKVWQQEALSVLSFFVYDASDVPSLYRLASQFESDQIQVYYHQRCVEIFCKGCDKSYALDVIRQRHPQLSVEDTWAFGDGPNDVPLLKAVAHPVVMQSLDIKEEVGSEEFFDNEDQLFVYLEGLL